MDNHIDDHTKNKPSKYIVVFILLISFIGIFFTFSKPAVQDTTVGLVLRVDSERNIVLPLGDMNKTIQEQDLVVEVNIGGEKQEIEVINDYQSVKKGDKIFLKEDTFGENNLVIDNISRTKALVILFVFFVVLVILTSGYKGIYSLIGLMFTFVVIFSFMLPQILKGANPILIGVGSAALILIVSLYLSYGFNKKSIAAFSGILITLLFVGIISTYFIGSLNFTGINEDSLYLDMATKSSINLIGLMIAGIIIAAVGVLDDVAVIQSSLVFSLASANKELRGLKLFREAMRVGRDHISAVVNTLVLAYTGASLPLMLLLVIQGMPISYFTSLEIVAEEIARTLISSSGLMFAVPLTTIIAVAMVGKKAKADIAHNTYY